MQKFLEKLSWLVNEETPCGRNNKDLQKAANTLCKCEDELTKRLKGEELELFIRSADAVCDMTAHIETENFVGGMRTGARLMLELLW